MLLKISDRKTFNCGKGITQKNENPLTVIEEKSPLFLQS
jgi:hypothetical protein